MQAGHGVSAGRRGRRTFARTAIAAALGTGSFMSMVHAQAPAPAGEQEDEREYRVAAGSLGVVLGQFAAAAGVVLSFDATLTAGKSSDGLSGRYGVRQGFDRLLAGTGLTAQQGSDGVYVLREAASSGAMLLSPVRVEGAVGSASSAVTEGTGSYTTHSTSAATGLNLSLRKTPQSVTVVTRQRLDDQALNTLGSVLEQTVGITQSSGVTYAAYNYTYSRGYRIANFDIDGVPGTGAVSVGGTGAWNDVSALETALYDSVAVIRGATGLLKGAGDPSGSVSLTRKRPTREFQASVEAGAGRWDRYRSVGDISGALNRTGTVRGRFVAVYDEGGSWKDRYEGDRKIAYGVIEADLADRTVFRVTLDHQNIGSSGDAQGDFFPILLTDGSRSPFSVSDSAITDWTRFQKESTGASVRVEHSFNENWQALLDCSRTWGESESIFGNIAIALNPDGTGRTHLRNVSYDQDWEGINFKLNGTYELFGRDHELVAGITRDLTRYDSSFIRDMSQVGYWANEGGQYVPEPDWSGYTPTLTDNEVEQQSLYVATRLNVRDKLSVLVGARLGAWETRTQNSTTGAVTDERKESDVLTPYAAITYDLTDHLTAYTSYTEIFNPQNFRDVNNSILDPEEGTNVEAGLKGEWFEGRLNAAVAIFQSGKDNLAIRDGDKFTPEGAPAYVAADDTEGRGWELEVSGEPAAGWKVQGGYTRMVLEDSDGDRLSTQYQPKHQIKLFSSWMPEKMNRLTVGGSVRWQSETYDDAAPALRDVYTQDAYVLVDLMSRYAFSDHLSLTVNLNNAFDETYRHSLLAYHYYGPPRNLYATLKYQF